MSEMYQLIELVTTWFSDIQHMDVETLQRLMKLGSQVQKVLQFTQSLSKLTGREEVAGLLLGMLKSQEEVVRLKTIRVLGARKELKTFDPLSNWLKEQPDGMLPSAEVDAVGEALASINAAVDACNVASRHSGLPISVVDLDRARAPFRTDLAPLDARYVFNASGQQIDLGGLLCLFDAEGPCANAVKDSQRTKTHAGTTRTFSIVWGTTALPGRTEATAKWYRELLHRLGCKTLDPS